MTLDAATDADRRISHRRMVWAWRRGLATPVADSVLDYVEYDGAWWARRSDRWVALPDGPFVIVLQAGRHRLRAAAEAAGTGFRSDRRGTDPWSRARSQLRSSRCPVRIA